MPEQTASAAQAHGEHPPLVTILVNDIRVEVVGHRLTGLEIKEAAIRAALHIDLGFQLIEELPHDRTRVVGDNDVVEVRADSRFLALAPDDNS